MFFLNRAETWSSESTGRLDRNDNTLCSGSGEVDYLVLITKTTGESESDSNKGPQHTVCSWDGDKGVTTRNCRVATQESGEEGCFFFFYYYC